MTFEVKQYGIKLFINPQADTLDGEHYWIDCETDEKDGFVGVALTNKPDTVFYYTSLEEVREILERVQISGHNIKGDIHWLKKWGIKVSESSIQDDSMIASYVMNPTAPSHSLKNLGKELLGLEWPSYKEMTHPSGSKKTTLDALPVETVANYCAMDAVVSFRLFQYLQKRMLPEQQNIYQSLEMPVNRLLFQMEEMGLYINKEYLLELSEKFKADLHSLELSLVDETGDEEFNPRSSQQIIAFCNQNGMYPREWNNRIHSTKASASKGALEKYKSNPFVKMLLEHKKVTKLNGYVKRYTTMTENGSNVVYPSISQISIAKDNEEQEGIKTGRLASDFHNIPRRSETGALLRRLFVANEGYSIICGDYSQIEYRLLAHFSKEPILLEAFKTGKDVHAETATLLGVKDRDLGKTFNFAAIYGAQPKRIAKTAGISEKEATEILKTYWAKLPNVTKWITLTREKAKRDGYITTLHDWQIQIPGIHSSNPWERLKAERQCINYVIQGSAAYIIKKAMLECQEFGFIACLQIHDELLVYVQEGPKPFMESRCQSLKQITENVLKLGIPLVVDIGYGKNWAEAKENAK